MQGVHSRFYGTLTASSSVEGRVFASLGDGLVKVRELAQIARGCYGTVTTRLRDYDKISLTSSWEGRQLQEVLLAARSKGEANGQRCARQD